MKFVKVIFASTLMLIALTIYAAQTDEDLEERGHGKAGEGTEKDMSDRGKPLGRSWTDSDGTDWESCDGKCTMTKRKVTRTDGVHIIIDVARAKKNGCDTDCSCVLFKSVDGWLVNKLEVSGDKDYLDITPDTGKGYQVRCCEED